MKVHNYIIFVFILSLLSINSVAEDLILYSDFNLGVEPVYSDWMKGREEKLPNHIVINEELILSEAEGVSEGRISFANTANIIKYDFKVENVNVVSPYFHIA